MLAIVCSSESFSWHLRGQQSEYVNPYIPTQNQDEDKVAISNHHADNPLCVRLDVWSDDMQI